jgi:hypothetical protein
MTIAALFVETNGCYFGLPGVEPWHGEDAADGSTIIHRDAREYDGPWPVISHTSCKRWGRFFHGSTRKPHQFELGDDGGAFMASVIAVHLWGGVIEHPAESRAWDFFGLPIPVKGAGWSEPDRYGGRSCYVEQVHYGHPARKATYLYAIGIAFEDFELVWDRTRAVVPQWMIDRYGEAKARKIGVVAMMGGKDKVRNRNATPARFRDVLIAMARSVQPKRIAA